jgi:hypothetical protein
MMTLDDNLLFSREQKFAEKTTLQARSPRPMPFITPGAAEHCILIGFWLCSPPQFHRRNERFRVLYTGKVCTTLSLKLLSTTRARLDSPRVCATRFHAKLQFFFKVLTLTGESEFKSGAIPRRTDPWTTVSSTCRKWRWGSTHLCSRAPGLPDHRHKRCQGVT